MNTNDENKLHHVLVIDDNVILLRTVKDMLESRYTVSIATSGAQAFESMSIKRPDLVLLDYEMPDMDGAEIMKILSESSASCDIPVIFLTSSASREVVTRLIKLNPAGYLLKPPNKQLMIDAIEKALGCDSTEESE